MGVGTELLIWQRIARLIMAALFAITVLVPSATITASAASGERSIYLYHTHTGETGRFTFWRNGGFDKAVLKKLNYFLRDWRTNEPTTMDPNLFNLLWAVYNEVGASNPINIVSSYRSPATNAMLAAKSSGVADNSQHMKGKAMDFFIPGIDLSKLRAVAMKHQVGGVGYYPTSGSPFVHLDTGSVRAWPRMTKAQLKKVFPDGKTMHLPTDGVPLSKDGYAYAQGQWQKCHMVPCSAFDAPTIMASVETDTPFPAAKPKTLLGAIFGAGEPAAVATVVDTGPSERAVATIDVVSAPVPMGRPSFLSGGDVQMAALSPAATPFGAASAPLDQSVPFPAQMSEALLLATRGGQPAMSQPDGQSAVSAIAALDAPMPMPRALSGATDVMTAYAALEPDPEAERALAMIISRETTSALPDLAPPATPQAPSVGVTALRSASLGETVGIDSLVGVFEATFSSVTRQGVAADPAAIAKANPPDAGIGMRAGVLVMPDIDHVAELFAHPVSFSGASFAVMFDHDEADFDPAAELGRFASRITWETTPTVGLAASRFVKTSPLLAGAT